MKYFINKIKISSLDKLNAQRKPIEKRDNYNLKQLKTKPTM